MTYSNSSSTEINFNKVLFLHINRTAQSVVNIDIYMAYIEVLDILLSPYQDDDYQKDLARTASVSSAIASMDGMCKTKGDMTRQNQINNATHKFRALMCLAEKKNLLLGKEGEGIDEPDAYDKTQGFEDPAQAI